MISLLLLVAATLAPGQDGDLRLARCEDWLDVPRVGALAQGVRVELRIRSGEVADPGEPFREGCTVFEGEASARLVFAGREGATWIVATEHGGIAAYRQFAAWRITDDGRVELLGGGFLPWQTADLCELITDLRRGVLELKSEW